MITLINKILFSNGYERLDIEPSSSNVIFYAFCLPEGHKREEYFVTIQLQEQSDTAAQELLHEKAQILFEEISNSGKVGRPFEKNCTLLICHEEEKISRQTILALEEDHYNFKKNVITYTSNELESLESYIIENEIEKITNNIISEIINSNSGRKFLTFKNDHTNKKDYYSLILKTALKLPFITYTPQEQQLTNLNDEIDKSLSLYQSTIYSQLMAYDSDWTDENIHQRVEEVWEKLV